MGVCQALSPVFCPVVGLARLEGPAFKVTCSCLAERRFHSWPHGNGRGPGTSEVLPQRENRERSSWYIYIYNTPCFTYGYIPLSVLHSIFLKSTALLGDVPSPWGAAALPIGSGCRPEFHRLEIYSDLPHGDFNHQTQDLSINHDNLYNHQTWKIEPSTIGIWPRDTMGI